MTVEELVSLLNQLLKTDPKIASNAICIAGKHQDRKTLGPARAEITAVSRGFDWNTGRILLQTEHQISIAKKKENNNG